MQWLKNQLYTHQFYKITKDGSQVSMMESDPYVYILHIQNDGKMKYHFIKNTYTLNCPYFILGMSIRIDTKDYILPANDFLVEGNELFSEIFMLWLCKHYLRINPCKTGLATILDENVDMHLCSSLIVHNNLKNDINYSL